MKPSEPRPSLGVLVIADPAADAPLPGALEEGEVVASIFERFARDTDQPVEVQRLFGPAEATPAAVRECLRTRYWDIIHFAGHGFLCDSDPSKSGWLFRADPLQTVTAEELASGSHAPYLVYFDACASGTSRDCRWLLARKLAEPFANRGVSNLICITPREDQASLDFTRRLYDKFFHYLWSAKPEDALAEAVSSARSHLAAQGGPPTGILVFQCSDFSTPQPEENHASALLTIWPKAIQARLQPTLLGDESTEQRSHSSTNVTEAITPTADLREANGRLSARRVAKLYGVSMADLAGWMGRSRQAVSKTPDAESLQEELLSYESIARLRVPLGSGEAFRKWLRIPNPHLDRRPPLDVIANGNVLIVADLSEDMLTGQPS